MTTPDERLIGLETSAVLARRLQATFFQNSIPLRGAIAFGPCHVDAKRSVWFGTALLDAIDLEKKQEWLGCSFTDGASEVIVEYIARAKAHSGFPRWQATFLGPLSPHTIHKYDVPVKKNRTESRWIVNWAGALIGNIEIKPGMFAPWRTETPNIDIKLDNTEAYLLWWQTILQDSLRVGPVIMTL